MRKLDYAKPDMEIILFSYDEEVITLVSGGDIETGDPSEDEKNWEGVF